MKVSVFDLLDSSDSLATAEPSVEPKTQPQTPKLNAAAVLEQWNERAAIMRMENPNEDTGIEFPPDADFETRERFESQIRRFWEICAAADLALQYGDYASEIIRPHLTPEDDTIGKGGESMRQHRPA
jgi:hypothetical protein